MNDDLSWFAARIVLEACHPEEPVGERLFEEQIILVRAPTEEVALQKAALFGKDAEHAYKNAEGRDVRWVFKEVLDIKMLFDDVIQDGTEVYHAFLAEDELAFLRRSFQVRGERVSLDATLAE